ncbi:hypothetical protein MASR1M31_20340 [Porphyromonadaceae bacterium]
MTEGVAISPSVQLSIAEASIVATAIGYAVCGGRVVPEIMYCDFLGGMATNISQMPKWQAMSGNILKVIVLRVSVGSKYELSTLRLDITLYPYPR